MVGADLALSFFTANFAAAYETKVLNSMCSEHHVIMPCTIFLSRRLYSGKTQCGRSNKPSIRTFGLYGRDYGTRHALVATYGIYERLQAADA